MTSNFGTPKKINQYPKNKPDPTFSPKNSDPAMSSSNLSSANDSNSIIEDQYKLFIKSMVDIFNYEKDPNISKRKFQIIKKISSSTIQNQAIDLNNMYFKEFEEEVQAFILIATYDEIHNLFMDFYGIFDEDQNFKIEKEESEKILNFMALESQMGKDKLEYLIEQLLEAFNPTNSLSLKLLQKQQQNQLSQDLKDEFFKLYASKSSKRIESQSLDMKLKYQIKLKIHKKSYLIIKKFFGVLLAFFFQFTRKRLQNRKDEWDKIRGIDNIKGIKTQITGMMTLSYALKSITGLDYMNEQDRNSKYVSFRNIEAVLLAYRNANKDIQLESIQRVLQDVEKYMKVDPQTKIEFKKVKMYKLIDYASMRIAFHRCCQNIANYQPNKFSFTEEIILWNSCSLKYKIRKEKIASSLQKYIQMNAQNYNLASDNQYILTEYLKKKWSILGKNSRDRIIKNMVALDYKTEDLPKKLHDEIIYETQYKIKFYIMKIFTGFGQSISDQQQFDFLQSRGAIKWSAMDEINNPILPSMNQNATIKGSKFQQQAALKSQRKEDESEGDISKEIGSSKFKIQERQSTLQDLQYEDRKTQTNVNNLKKQNNGDILNACFMMEGLLEKVQYMKKEEIKKLKKQNVRSNQILDAELQELGSQVQSLEHRTSILTEKQSPPVPKSSSVINAPKSSFITQRGSQQTIGMSRIGGTYQRSSESHMLFEDLKRIQPDDYQDDILDSLSFSQNEQENKQELMNNSVIGLMMMNNQKYQRRSEFQYRYPLDTQSSKDQIQEDLDDLGIRKSTSQKRSIVQQSRFGIEKSQNIQNEQLQPKINKDIFNEVRRQQAIDRLSYYQMMQRQADDNEDKLKREKNSTQNRTCANCNIF